MHCPTRAYTFTRTTPDATHKPARIHKLPVAACGGGALPAAAALARSVRNFTFIGGSGGHANSQGENYFFDAT